MSLEPLYASLGLELPTGHRLARCLTFALAFDPRRKKWNVPSGLVPGLVYVHTIACTAWSSVGSTALTIKALSSDGADKMADIRSVYSNSTSDSLTAHTDVFTNGGDATNARCYLHRHSLVSEISKIPGISVDVIEKAFVEVDGKYRIPRQSVAGALLYESCRPKPAEPPAEYVISVHKPNEELAGVTGQAFLDLVLLTLKSDVQPMNLANLGFRANGDGDNWGLQLRVEIVYRRAS